MPHPTTRNIQTFLFLRKLTNALVDTLSGSFDGLILGALSDEALGTLDENEYNHDQRYQNDDYNRSGLWHWEQAFVDLHLPGRRRIAVTGAGGGREVLALLRQGFDVVGYEPNANLVRFGNGLLAREGFAPCLRVSPRNGWPEDPDKHVDAVIVGWGAYTHLAGKKVRIEFLAEAHRRMAAGGPLLASFWDRTGSSRYYRTVLRVGNVLRRVRRARLLDRGDALGKVFVHFFDRAEIASEFRSGGFTLHSFEIEGYARAVGLADSPGPTVFAR